MFAQETKENAKLNAALDQKKKAPKRIEAKSEVRDKASFADRKVFTWERVDYTVPVPGGTRRLLHEVYGYVKPGTMTALMGASGAGKTTCLDVLAQRKNIGVISGDLLVDGKPLGTDFARGTAYAEQMDVHEGTATVREAMRFSAYLRQPYDVPKEEKDAYIEEVIELLELQPMADAIVMSLNVEARKRLTIGVELASKPELLLFLDEPTSGLDAQSAWNIVRFLRKLADQGQAILCTIHQPSALLFSTFDRLLLLERGGETVSPSLIRSSGVLMLIDPRHSHRFTSEMSVTTLLLFASTLLVMEPSALMTSTLPSTCSTPLVLVLPRVLVTVTGPTFGEIPRSSGQPSRRSNGSRRSVSRSP